MMIWRNFLALTACVLFMAISTSDAFKNDKRPSIDEIKKSNIKPDRKYVYLRENNRFESSVDYKGDDWVAFGLLFRNEFNLTGWYILEVETNPKFNDSEQAIAAGVVEGDLTADLINNTVINMVGDQCQNDTDPLCDKLKKWINENINWMTSQINADPGDPYWHQVSLVLYQFAGLVTGYSKNDTLLQRPMNEILKAITDEPASFNLLLLQLGGDLFELLSVIQGTVDPFYAGSCSALVKVLDNNADVFISHVTWSEFNMMLRVLKNYKFHFHLNDKHDIEVPGFQVTFSSYPGIIVSIDDFYVSSANLAIIETTIGNSNADLWKYVTPQTNLYWIRVQVANRLASTGPDWARTFALFNSGTYNNEWMVLDYKLFTPGEPLRDNFFIVLEQLPGQVEWADQTDVLRTKSFWSSYNIPFYPDIYNISGYRDNYLKYGDIFSYQNTSRAKIFDRDAGKIKDMNDMIKMMRYNNYTHDPFSKCNCTPPYSSELTIAARSDLNPENGTYPIDMLGHRQHGATDMKVTSYNLARKQDFIAICGPTHNSEIPPFVWSQSDFDKKVSHVGLPDRYEFPQYQTQWNF